MAPVRGITTSNPCMCITVHMWCMLLKWLLTMLLKWLLAMMPLQMLSAFLAFAACMQV